jgi:hypothetical protein
MEDVSHWKGEVDVVVIGGPTNSLVRHGREGERGFGGERQVRMTKNREGEEECHVTYHMTDPVKLPMTEKEELVDRMVSLLTDIKRMMGNGVRVVHVTMFPRFVEECCRSHMTDEDVWLLDGIRRDVNREIKETLLDIDIDIEVVDWWTLMGMRSELMVNKLRRSDTVDKDNVHLTIRANRVAAATLIHRLLDRGGAGWLKRRRLE